MFFNAESHSVHVFDTMDGCYQLCDVEIEPNTPIACYVGSLALLAGLSSTGKRSREAGGD